MVHNKQVGDMDEGPAIRAPRGGDRHSGTTLQRIRHHDRRQLLPIDGTAAVAAVGSNAPVTGLILNLFIGIALGANVVIANAISDEAAAKRCATPCTRPSSPP